MGSLIRDRVTLAFVHGCQFITLPRLFHHAGTRYVQILTTLPELKRTLYPVGIAVEETKMKI